ncbi:DUF2877 domain-containing protein [Citrobacter sp. Ct235]|uniref:DUF2877 domain-containing protein n=1 Tax=Citrobacter sp. Ct235 TaxID=2985157 RepID=UPI0025761CBD|nr:DUF2877 domain-containing protein [Citrobacter sp. Ct235]MDM2734669.1 DUF2877 domain-containing protein [Citrobacter sp. Ct235]
MLILNALACAGLYRLPDGEWTLHSRFSQAINFSHANGELLTLYRYGKGMGPTGMLLSHTQFSRLTAVSRLYKTGNLLSGQGVTLRSQRQLRLQLNPADSTPVGLSRCGQQSGLCGALNQPLNGIPFYSEIMAALACWHHGGEPDWRWLIGRGPGLTPSGDDMLTGMLAVFIAAGIPVHLFLPSIDQLALLTTSVSCSYLNSARLGEFSTPVLGVMRSLQTGRNTDRALGRLLAVGHTSGADTVLGIALAQHWLQMADSRGMHARSGNNTHIYSGG